VVGYGFAIEIEDRGLGMTAEELESANEQLRNPPEFRLTSTARLGLYVVGKLAERHGIKVRLTESPYGGTTAIVLLPGTLMADDGGGENPNRGELESVDDGRSVQLAGVGRHRLEAEAAAVRTDTPALTATDRYGPTGPDTVNDRSMSDRRDRPPNDRSGTDTAAPANGSRTGHGSNGFVTATPALTPVTPVSGTPAVTPNGLPTRPVPSQPTGPSTMDSAVAPLVTPSGLPWRQRPSSPGEPAPATATATAAAPPAAPIAPQVLASPAGPQALTSTDVRTRAGGHGARGRVRRRADRRHQQRCGWRPRCATPTRPVA
jgi:hypothetical protein